ncbi:MAG: hypothetical protein HRT68_05565 [Flavobacteriaceae bacterium]|nr:hypothetical protein [Flavobacteriaceae bacterium]
MRKLLYLIVCFSFILGCKSDDTVAGDNKKEEKNSSEKSAKVSKQLYEFSPNAEQDIAEWSSFKLLTEKMDLLIKESNTTDIESLDELSKSIASVEKTIPQRIQNLSLNARLTVLKTQLGMYRDVVSNPLEQPKELHVKFIHNIIDAYNHCVFQVNDIVEKLETEERYKDLQ